MTRSGILAAGNFIIDYVKLIDAWPDQDMLTNILSETSSNGGGPYNVLKDLSAMGAEYPLEACGLVGKDANGDWILRDCHAAGIDTKQLHQTADAPTSYTDAMTVATTGRRTFFHQRGANAKFDETHVDFSTTTARHFHLGYLMLLDTMDRFASAGRTHASLALEAAKQAGLSTSVDIVSTENTQFREIAESALPFTDVLVINEIEAGKVAGLDLKGANGANVGCLHRSGPCASLARCPPAGRDPLCRRRGGGGTARSDREAWFRESCRRDSLPAPPVRAMPLRRVPAWMA